MTDRASLESQFDELLGGICRDWGFCLPWSKIEEISAATAMSDREFAIRVLEAERFKNPHDETEWIERLSARFREHFGRAAVAVDAKAT